MVLVGLVSPPLSSQVVKVGLVEQSFSASGESLEPLPHPGELLGAVPQPS